MDLIPCMVSKEICKTCDLDLSLDDLAMSLHKITDDKELKLNGFTCEFYKSTWDFVGHDLPTVYKEFVWKNPLRNFINKCLLRTKYQYSIENPQKKYSTP